MARRVPRTSVANLGVRPRLFRGRLAEDYDGIGQYVRVQLSQGASAVAQRVRVPPGDFGGGRKLPAGWIVNIFSYRGDLEVVLGNHPKVVVDDEEN